jgi:hypothetical protein
MRKSSRATLRDAFKRLEHEMPDGLARIVRKLRHPEARWIRIPVGMLFVLGGVLGPIFPLLGVWMLPIGLLFIAYDVPFLRRPVAGFTIWGADVWAGLKLRVKRSWARQG